MSLFPADSTQNLLPCDGTVLYHGPLLSPAAADRFFQALQQSVPWRNDELVMFGRRIVTSRQVAWFGSLPFAYTYSGTTHHALPWTAELLELLSLAEQHAGTSYNSCLLNLYHDGSEGMGWHSDDEKTILADSSIASVSLGAERRFCFKHKHTDQTAEILLEHGSLLEMRAPTQTHWLHSIPKSKKITSPRINLTFRTMAAQATA